MRFCLEYTRNQSTPKSLWTQVNRVWVVCWKLSRLHALIDRISADQVTRGRICGFFEMTGRVFEEHRAGWPMWQSFAAHSMLVLFVIPLVGLLNYWITPLSGGILAFLVIRRRSSVPALFAWIPALIPFLYEGFGTFRSWSPSWSHETQWGLVTNRLFGPNCQSSECFGLIWTAIMTGGIGYSLVALVIFFLRRQSR